MRSREVVQKEQYSKRGEYRTVLRRSPKLTHLYSPKVSQAF
jgi:hypothetical protein